MDNDNVKGFKKAPNEYYLGVVINGELYQKKCPRKTCIEHLEVLLDNCKRSKGRLNIFYVKLERVRAQ